MRAALLGVDIIDKAVDIFLIAVVVLHGDLNDGVVLHAVEVDRLLVDRLFFAIEVGDKGADAAVKVEGLAAHLVAALVGEGDRDAVVEEGELAQAMLQRVKAVGRDGEDLGVGDEVDARARCIGRADLVQLRRGDAARKGDRKDFPITAHLDVHLRGESVDDGDADTVQTARDLVAVAAEFAARMEDGQNDLDSGHAALVHIDGDAASVVRDGDAVVLVYRDADRVAVARERLVDGVVDDLVDEMVQAALGGRADIHTGTFAHRLQSLQHLDLPRAVVRVDGSHLIAHLLLRDRDAREIRGVCHLGGFLCLLGGQRTDLRLLVRCFILVLFLCHYILLGGIELLI